MKASKTPDAAPRSATEGVAIAEEVASELRHDLRNKFTSIGNCVSYIRKSLSRQGTLEHDPRVARFLGLIEEQLEAADRLLDQRARHAGLVPEQPGRFCLAECVRQAVARRVVPPGVELGLSLDEQAFAQGNAEEIAMAIGCLLDNALEAVGARGRVGAEVATDGTRVVVRIVDTGPGIPRERREAALRAFASDKPGHAGLGLNIAARAAGRHGGQLTLDDVGGRSGTVVSISLPQAGAA